MSVIDDGCRLTDEHQELFARALGEAVTNVFQHALAKRIVVFVETDDRGQVFASVRDDGRGFDTSVTQSSHGLNESVLARIESIGGCATVASTTDGSGSGTEVCLWSSTRMAGSPS